MKKTILLFLTFLTYQFTFSQCHYVVDMQDSYGDGWNGAQINVSINLTCLFHVKSIEIIQ